MGCYDIVFLETECPYCGLRSEIEFQTKNLDCNFKVYRVGDKVEGVEQLDATGSCCSPQCQEKADKLWIIWQGTPSGFGAGFDVNIELDENSVITGKILDIIKSENYTDDYLNSQKEKWEGKYKPRKETSLLNDEWIRKKR